MSRFSVYLNPIGKGYLLDVQADALSHLNTRMMIPLLPIDIAPRPAKTLNPLFDFDGTVHSMATQYMAAVPLKSLKNAMFRVDERRHEIVAAIDLLLQGF